MKVSSDMGLVGSFSHVLRFPQSSRSGKLWCSKISDTFCINIYTYMEKRA